MLLVSLSLWKETTWNLSSKFKLKVKVKQKFYRVEEKVKNSNQKLKLKQKFKLLERDHLEIKLDIQIKKLTLKQTFSLWKVK